MDKYVSLEIKRSEVSSAYFKALKAKDFEAAQELRIKRDAIDKELEKLVKRKPK